MFLTSCSKQDNEAASYLGLEMGKSKISVIEDLRNNPSITRIRPAITKFIEVKSNTNNKDELINLLVKQPGIVIERKNPMIAIQISFVDDLVSNVYLAPVNKGQDFGIVVGMKNESIKKLLHESFSNKKIDHIFNFMPRNDLISIENMDQKERSWLLENNTWTFGEIDRHSSTRLYFSNDKLISIDYSWTPIELP